MTGILLQIAYLGAIGFCCCTSGWLLLQADSDKTTRALAICQGLIIIWCLPQLFLVFADSREIKYLLYGISYFGICLIGPCWLIFSFSYCGRQLKKMTLCLLFGLSVFDCFMFWTNRFHHLFYLRFELDEVVYGPVFYFHMGYTYLCVLAGMGEVACRFRPKRRKKSDDPSCDNSGGEKENRKNQTVPIWMILLAAAVPLGFNLLYLTKTIKTGFDLTPPVFALSSFLMLVAVFRYDFLDVNTAVSRHIFASIAEGVIVCNKQGRVTCCNDAAFRWLGVKNGDEYFMVRDKIQTYREPENQEEKTEVFLLRLPGKEIVQGKEYTLYNRRGKETQKVLLLTDVKEYYERMRQNRELAVSQQQLAIEQERNRIAQEVHDTTGHTLTMINSLIKLIRIQCDEEKEDETQLKEYLNQAQELALDGIRQLRWSINHMRMGEECGLVTQGVYQLAGSVKEMEVEVEIQGEDDVRYSHLSAIVYSCLREAITNSLKYAHGSHMDVIVKFGTDSLNVYIFDNGQGCDVIKENHGLYGIRQRVENAGGQARFLSAQGEGFQMFLWLPVTEKVS